MKPLQAIIAAALSMLVASCGGGGSSPENQVVGPCFVRFDEPILTLTAASDGSTSAAIQEITLHSMTLNGVKLDLLDALSVARNVSAVGDVLVCRLPCGFSNDAGAYKFTAKAVGYQDQLVSISATYSSFRGNCPAFYSGTTSAALMFTAR